MELNGGSLTTLVIALFFLMGPAILQYAWLRIFKSKIIRRLPIIICVTIWIICVMGVFGIIDLPHTSTIDAGFMRISDFVIIAIIGIPVNVGLALAWFLHTLDEVHKKDDTDPKNKK